MLLTSVMLMELYKMMALAKSVSLSQVPTLTVRHAQTSVTVIKLSKKMAHATHVMNLKNLN